MSNCDCGKRILSVYGDRGSNIMVIADKPGFEDLKNGQCFSSEYGQALQIELSKVGIQPQNILMFNLWMHSTAKGDTCPPEVHYTNALKTMSKAKLVLMLGSESLTYFCDTTEMISCGTIVKSVYLPKTVIVAGPNIAALGKTPIGELKLALELFAKERRKIK